MLLGVGIHDFPLACFRVEGLLLYQIKSFTLYPFIIVQDEKKKLLF